MYIYNCFKTNHHNNISVIEFGKQIAANLQTRVADTVNNNIILRSIFFKLLIVRINTEIVISGTIDVIKI